MPSITVLGFDYGRKYIGVAVGQDITQTARPLPVLQAQTGHPPWATIDALITSWHPTHLLVGIPLHMDGTSQDITLEAQNFARTLEKRFQLPIIQVDERLSTVMARDYIFEKKGYRGLQKRVDSVAAQMLVEEWLRTKQTLVLDFPSEEF